MFPFSPWGIFIVLLSSSHAPLYLCIVFTFIFERQSQRETRRYKDKGRESKLPSGGLFPKFSQWLGLGQAETRNWEVSSGLHVNGRNSATVPSLLPNRVCIRLLDHQQFHQDGHPLNVCKVYFLSSRVDATSTQQVQSELNCGFKNSYIEVLIPSATQCDFMWR